MEETVKATILVADDEPQVRKALETVLQMEGYSVIHAENGHEVLAKVKIGNPDVILLDLRMPGIDGLEIIRVLKSNESWMRIPIIIVTGQDDIQSRVDALKLGADDFLVKPPHFAELSARVKSLIKVKAYNDYMVNHQMILELQVAARTKELRETMEKLKHASLDTIYRLSRAAEYKDEDMSVHLHRMSNYASALGRTVGVGLKDIEMLLYTTPMHDIGKIGIPDKVLLKPGKLDDGEWELMKQHAEIGGSLLEGSTSEYLKSGRIIALTHHEKWDGSGYPKGIKGKTIPIEGRIAAVADVFDALTSQRTYKKAFTTDEAFRILLEGRGTHFDPVLVDAFLSIKYEILKIRSSFDDKNPLLSEIRQG